MASLSSLVLKKSYVIKGMCLRVSDHFSRWSAGNLEIEILEVWHRFPVIDAAVANSYILDPSNPSQRCSKMLQQLGCFALKTNFPTSEFCHLRPSVNSDLVGFFLCRSSVLRDNRTTIRILCRRQAMLGNLCSGSRGWSFRTGRKCRGSAPKFVTV